MPKILTPQWIERLTEIATYLLDHDCLPTKDGGLDEARMTQWLTHQRRDYNNDSLVPEQRDLLEATGIPQTGWLDGDRDRRYDAAWFTNFRAVVKHLADNGRRPSTASTNPDEMRLGKWLSLQLSTRDELPEHRLTALVDAGLTDLPNTTRLIHADTWHRRLAELDAFVTEHGRRPTHNATDEVEKPIGQWLAKQRVAVAKDTLAEERLARLVEIQERTGVDLLSLLKRDVVGAIIARVAAFHAEHGRMPTFREPDGMWLANVRHRQRVGTLAPATAKGLAKIDPNWVNPARQDVRDSIKEIADFAAEHGRMPARSKVREGAIGEENLLAERLNSYRERDRSGNLSDAARAMLDKQVPDWRVLPSHARFMEHLRAIAAIGPDAKPKARTTLYRWRYSLLVDLREQRVPAARLDLIREHAPWLLTESRPAA
jgi:hypothetical protein